MALVNLMATTPHLCGFNIASAIVFILSAMVCEGKTLNRIKKLEEEIENLKRR